MTRPEDHLTDALGLIRAWPAEPDGLTPENFREWHAIARQYEGDHDDPLALTGGAVRIARALAQVQATYFGCSVDEVLDQVYNGLLAAITKRDDGEA